jgi:hypothetical protein
VEAVARHPEIARWLVERLDGAGMASEAAKWVKLYDLDPLLSSSDVQAAFSAGDYGSTARALVLVSRPCLMICLRSFRYVYFDCFRSVHRTQSNLLKF